MKYFEYFEHFYNELAVSGLLNEYKQQLRVNINRNDGRLEVHISSRALIQNCQGFPYSRLGERLETKTNPKYRQQNQNSG
jgi:hypothetical protein